jgi:hypothetical protein
VRSVRSADLREPRRPFLSPPRCRSGRACRWSDAQRSTRAHRRRTGGPAPVPMGLGYPLLGCQRALRDLARGGVCRAPLVTERAVRSYRPVSPLPEPEWMSARRADLRGPSAVYFLWHSPSRPAEVDDHSPVRCARVGVTHHRVLSCSDFPRRITPPPRPSTLTMRLYESRPTDARDQGSWDYPSIRSF